MRALLLVAALLALCGSAAAEEPLCTPQDLAVLDRWKQWLADERTTINGAYDQIAKLRAEVDQAAWLKNTAELSNHVFAIVEAVNLVKKLPLLMRAAVDLKRVRGLSSGQRIGFDVDEGAFKVSKDVDDLFELAAEIADSPGDLAEKLLQGRYDNIRDQAVRATNDIIAVRERRSRLYATMRDKYVQTKKLCDEDAATRTAGAIAPTASKPAEESTLHRELMLAAKEIAPVGHAPAGASTPAPVDLGAIDRALRGNAAGAAPAAPRPVTGGIDLGALDRMAGTNPASIAPAQAPQEQRRPSEDAYLEACLGNEKSAACHRAHCLHVGAALNDKKWTSDCLKKGK